MYIQCSLVAYLQVFNNKAPYEIEKPISLNQNFRQQVNTLASK